MGNGNVCVTPYIALEMIQPVYFLSTIPLNDPSATLAGASIRVDPYGNVNIIQQMHPQVVLVPMMYPAHIDPTNRGGQGAQSTGTVPEHPSCTQMFTQSATNATVPVVQSMDATVPMGGVDLLDARPVVPFHGSNPRPEGVETIFADVYTHDGTRISFPLPRLTKTGRLAPMRSPPRTVEANLGTLCTRLLAEGADIEAVEIVREVIFASSVSEEALMAPINTYKKWGKYGRATKVWQLLLITKEETPRKKSYCCRLCPEAHRPEYKYARDAVRHFKKDHFGFAVTCIHW